MAEVVLDQLWLHDAADLSVFRRFYTSGRGDKRAVDGAVRDYANGRRRVITRAGSSLTLTATLRLVTDDDLAALVAWRGALLMLRDHRGRLAFGSYFGLSIDDYEDRSGYDVELSFADVTHSIEV